MRAVDWAVVLGYIAWVVIDGLRRAKSTDKVEGYFLGNRSLPWWVAGLSVMATQMSAVTLVPGPRPRVLAKPSETTTSLEAPRSGARPRRITSWSSRGAGRSTSRACAPSWPASTSISSPRWTH